MRATSATHATNRIGPNAITRVAEALQQRNGEAFTALIFGRAGLLRYLGQPPQSMVDEAEVMRLHRVLRASVGPVDARAVARDAGRRTADYLLARRIPRPVQALLRHLPSPLARACCWRRSGATPGHLPAAATSAHAPASRSC